MLFLTAAFEIEVLEICPMKDNGTQKSPMRKERLKFTVASAERKRPRRRRVKDLIRVRDCVGGVVLAV